MTRRIVVDAGVMASGLMRPEGACGSLLRRWLVDGSFEVVVSPAIMSEIEAVLREPGVRELLGSERDATQLTAALSVLATWVDERGPRASGGGDMYLRAASAADSSVIVSNDPDLLARTNGEVEVLSPATYLDLLELA